MAVNVDTVYQRVLSLANKEQRGYITPQEYNLYANQAQMEIFEQYFYDINQFGRMIGNNTDYSDMIKILEEKITIFETDQDVPSGNVIALPGNLYRLGTIMARTAKNGTSWAQVEMLSRKEFDLMRYTKLAKPTPERPVMYKSGNTITMIRGMNGEQTMDVLPSDFDINIQYVRTPDRVTWGYVVVNEKSLYNANSSTNFELHPSDETELVYRILKLAGINLNKAEVVQVGQALETQQIQQEKQ
tara:strand:+ start:366 stop:1097 length:732 start_codon:yes stop_codon:yes gene_type:complete